MDWREFVSLHHKIEVINENTIRVYNIAYDFDENKNTKNWYDDVLTKIPEGYLVDSYINNTEILHDSHIEKSIYNYLNY